MSHSNPALEFRKFITHRSLLIARESPLPRPLSYSARYSPGSPASSSAGRPEGYPVRNLESCLACYSVSSSAGYPEMNSASYSESCRDRCSASRSAERPEDRPASSPDSNLPSNGAENPLSYLESSAASSPADCLGSALAGSLSRQHDLEDISHVPRPSSLAPDEIHSRRQRPHVSRARHRD